jgi:glycosyltransferase involved in cell wall biosynthesis
MSELESSGIGGGPKVIIVSPRLDIGGTEKHILRVLPELRRRGIDVSLFLLERGGKLEPVLAETGISIAGPKFVRLKLRRMLRSQWELYRHLRRERPDIVHFFLPAAYLIGSIASMLAKIDMRFMSRRSLDHYQARHFLVARFEKWLHRNTDVLLGNSNAVVSDLIRESGDHDKVGLIYNGITIPQPVNSQGRMASRDILGIASERLVIAIVANLISYKGYEDLLDGLALANKRLPRGWRLLVIGRDNGIGQALKAKVEYFGLTENVIWAGERPDAEELIVAADIAVLTSREEGFSNSVIEAMARGIPVIATAVGGNLDAVVNGETGFLVPVKAPQAFADAVIALATDPALRSRFGEAGRQRTESLFSLDVCVKRYVNLYKGVARLGHGPVQAIITEEG